MASEILLTKVFSTTYSPKSSTSDSSGIAGVMFIAIIVVAVIIFKSCSNTKKQKEEKAREERLRRWQKEEAERKKMEEQKRQAEEERRVKEELRAAEEKQKQEEKRRQIATETFILRKQEVDEWLEGRVLESNQAYCKMYDFQKTALVDLFDGKKFCIMPTGTGKTVVMFNWLKYCDRKKILIVTTASKRDSKDFEREADTWCGMGWKESLDSFEVISWHGLSKWVISHWQDIDTYVFAFDEVHNAGAGVNSVMGRAFLQLTHHTDCWTGYTATPGDAWIRFCPFFAATGKIRNRVEFERNYTIQSFGGGHPYISGYRQTSELENMWRGISTAPDASIIFKEMPTEQEEYIEFEKPANYENTLCSTSISRMKTLDEVMSLCHSLRQQCCTKNKLDWIKDFLDGLNTNAIIFYNYKIEGERLEEEIKKKLPKGAKIWHIDGRRHDIPTEHTIGKHDVVLIQYASGSSSLNLQFINYWVSFSPNYSYTLNVQAKYRIKRIGQKHTMFFYYFKTRGTIEDNIYRCLAKKKDFSEKVWAIENGYLAKDNSEP